MVADNKASAAVESGAGGVPEPRESRLPRRRRGRRAPRLSRTRNHCRRAVTRADAQDSATSEEDSEDRAGCGIDRHVVDPRHGQVCGEVAPRRSGRERLGLHSACDYAQASLREVYAVHFGILRGVDEEKLVGRRARTHAPEERELGPYGEGAVDRGVVVGADLRSGEAG